MRLYFVLYRAFCMLYSLYHFNNHKDQSNLTKGGIARLYSPGGSIGLTVWLQFAIPCFGWGFNPKISLFPGGQGPHLTQCVTDPHKCTCQMASRSVERFKQGARMWQTTDDRQTGHAVEKCVGIGGIVCMRCKMQFRLIIVNNNSQPRETSYSNNETCGHGLAYLEVAHGDPSTGLERQ